MNYEEVEDSIVARLAPLTESEIGFIVEAIPETEAEFEKAFIKPKITVAYKGSKPEDNGKKAHQVSTDVTQQNEILHIEILMQAKKLRGAHGLYLMCEVVRALLIGFKPTNCRKLFMVNYGVVEHTKQKWTHCLTLGCDSILMEQPDDIIEVLLNKAKMNDETTDQEVIVQKVAVPVISFVSKTQTSITFAIAETEGATKYEIDVSQNADFSEPIISGGLIDLVENWEITGLVLETKYFIRARGKNDHFESGNSNVLNITTLPCAVPGTPETLPATEVTLTSFKANHALVAGALDHVIDISLSADFSGFVVENLSIGNTGYYEFLAAITGTQYFYRVRGVNDCGPSENSLTVSVTTESVPATPVLLSMDVQSFVVSLNLEPADGATSYIVDISDNIDFNTYVLLLLTAQQAHDFSIGNVAQYNLNIGEFNAGINLNCRIRAVNIWGNSGYSNIVNFNIPL